MYRTLIIAATFYAGLLAAPALAAPVKTCTADDQSPHARFGVVDVAAHRQFELPVITYPFAPEPRHGGPLILDLLIDETGHVVCDFRPEGTLKPTRYERAVLDGLSAWTYAPFTRNGVPVKGRILEFVYEQEAFEKIVPMPDGPASGFAVTLSHACYDTCATYSITVKGDGSAMFSGGELSDVRGDHEYHLPPETLKALIDAARKANIWSARDRYAVDGGYAQSRSLNLTIGGQSKWILDRDGDARGMPKAVTQFMADVDALSGANDMTRLSATGVARLQAGGFDFTSQAGADLLARANGHRKASDEAVLAVIQAGAPLKGDLLPIAIALHRPAVVNLLIGKGLLLNNGTPDQKAIDAAFQAAIRAGHVDVVQVLWSYHPSLSFTVPADDGGTQTFPVTLLLDGEHHLPDGWDGLAIARFLLEHGCDINAADFDGKTLLHIAAIAGDAPLTRYLLDHGARVDAQDKDADTPLNYADDDAVAILLLDAGADPLHESTYLGTFAEQARADDRKPVLVWFRAHGVKGF